MNESSLENSQSGLSTSAEIALTEERNKKQDYLRDQILGSNLNAMDFKNFCDELKPNGGSDVDVWTLQELVNVVEQFKIKYGLLPAPKPQAQQVAQNKKNEKFADIPITTESTIIRSTDSTVARKTTNADLEKSRKISEEVKEPHGLVNQQNGGSPGFPSQTKEEFAGLHSKEEVLFAKIIDVKKSEITVLNSEPSIAISISEPTLVKGGIFSSSYMVYKVTTLPFNWNVKRRFSDFYWLRGVLVKLFPSLALPPIPNKKAHRRLEQNFIQRRVDFLEKFLNACMASEDIRTSKHLLYFLSIEDENNFKNRKKEGDRIPKISKIEEISNLNGQVELEINPDLKGYADQTMDFINHTEPVYKKMKKLAKQLIIDWDAVSNTIFSLGECFGTLYNTSSNFNKNVTTGKNLVLDDIYLNLNNMFMSWGERTLEQIRCAQDGLSNFFKYQQYELSSLKELLFKRQTAFQDYSKAKQAMILKKEQIFTKGDYTRWEIPAVKLNEVDKNELRTNKTLAFDLMFPKDTQHVIEVKELFAYYNKTSFEEIQRIFEWKNKMYAKNFTLFTKMQSENLVGGHIHFADCMAHFKESGGIKHLKNSGSILIRDSLKSSQKNEAFPIDDHKVDDHSEERGDDDS